MHIITAAKVQELLYMADLNFSFQLEDAPLAACLNLPFATGLSANNPVKILAGAF